MLPGLGLELYSYGAWYNTLYRLEDGLHLFQRLPYTGLRLFILKSSNVFIFADKISFKVECTYMYIGYRYLIEPFHEKNKNIMDSA